MLNYLKRHLISRALTVFVGMMVSGLVYAGPGHDHGSTTDTVQSGAFFPRFYADSEQYEVVGIETIDGKDLYILKTNDGKSEEMSYYEKGTWMKVKSISIEQANGEAQTTEMTYDDYKPLNGIKFPYKMSLTAGPMGLNGEVKTITINGKIDFSTFK